jgi:hypothetical protein
MAQSVCILPGSSGASVPPHDTKPSFDGKRHDLQDLGESIFNFELPILARSAVPGPGTAAPS